MLRQFFAVCLLMIFANVVYGQERNQRDAAGLRQGYWEAVDSRGMLVYAGYFKDDKPIGEMIRFFPTGDLRAIMNYDDTGDNVRAQFFWPTSGRLAAEGNYIDTQRDSVWQFYNQEGILMLRVQYSTGKRHGTEQKFYNDGRSVAEEISWSNDQKDGAWKQYFRNGQLKISANHINDKLEGSFSSFFPDGTKEIEGVYENGLHNGNWIRYNEEGEYIVTIKYENGVITNMEELEETEILQFLRTLEMEEYIPERTIDDLFR